MSNKYKYESHLEYFKIQGVFDFDYNSLRLLMEIQKQSGNNQVFRFNNLINYNNKLINKKLNIIYVDDKQNVIQCKDTQNQPTVTKAENCLNLQNCVSYFEVEVLHTTQQDLINIGLVSKDCNNKVFIGKTNNSFGYIKGDLYLDKKKLASLANYEKLKQGDRIGIGINCYKRKLFIVKNQSVVQKDISISNTWNQFFPAVALSVESEKVKLHFTVEKFRFKIHDYCKTIQAQLQKQIEESNYFSNNQIYSLVHQYLAFNNYSSTLSLLKQKKIQYHQLSRYTKNPSVTPEIDLEKKPQESMDEEMNQPLKLRNRIMSQRLNQNQQQILQVRRKNTEMIVEQVPVPRKCSLISNMSNISNIQNIPLSEQKQFFQSQDQQIMEVSNQNQIFLDNQRRIIIQKIRNKRIEEAIQLLQKYIPEIFSQKCLMAFMKAHIFLRKVKEQSNKQAISYTKKEKDSLKDYFGSLCPFFNSGSNKVEWKPLNTIYMAMAFNAQAQCKVNQSGHDLLSDQQFNVFANYVNRLIMKKMGYLSCSRLTYFANYMKKIQQKLKEFKGMSCGIQISL